MIALILTGGLRIITLVPLVIAGGYIVPSVLT